MVLLHGLRLLWVCQIHVGKASPPSRIRVTNEGGPSVCAVLYSLEIHVRIFGEQWKIFMSLYQNLNSFLEVMHKWQQDKYTSKKFSLHLTSSVVKSEK